MLRAGLGDGDPEVHIGQLSNALLRNGPISPPSAPHQGMTIDQSERLFREQAYQTGNARSSCARHL